MAWTKALVMAADFDWSEHGWIVYVPLGLLGFFFLVVPLIIFAQQKFEARPTMVRFDLDEYDWPAEIQQLFTEAVGDLTEMGFEIADGLFLPSAVQNVKTALVLLVNRTESDAAMVTAMYAQPVTATSIKSLYIEFSTRFEDDFVYDTNNSTQLNAFPPRESTQTHQLVTIRDARALYQVHQAIMQREGRNRSQKVLRIDRDFHGDAVRYLQEAVGEEFAAAADEGYIKLTSDGETYTPTIKGAFLMVWKELWPWKLVRKMNRNQEAQALLNDLAREGVEIKT